jgi:hypothetical protein
MGDGIVMGDGVLMSDGVLMADVSAAANNAMIFGDGTTVMDAIPDPTPEDPSGLTAKAASRSQINLTWLDNATNETGFAVERCAGSTCTNFAQIATVGAGVKSFANTGLASTTAYRYRVRAFNGSAFSSYTTVVGATTLK